MMATEGDTIQAAVAQGSQKTADRVQQEQVMAAGSFNGVQVARPGGNTRNDPSRFLSLGQLLESGELESSSTAPVTIRVNARQSGVPGVRWHSQQRRWQVCVYEGGVRRFTNFPIRKYIKLGMSEEEASKAALEAAIVCRRSQEASGTAKVCQGAGGRSSGKQVVTRGVLWDKRSCSWYAQITVKGKNICGGRFKPKDDSPQEAEKARVLALECRRALEKQYFRVEVQATEKSEVWRRQDLGMTGVCWDTATGSWRASITVNGKFIHGGYFKPKDDTAEEVNFARRLAMARRRSLEKQYRRVDVLASEDSEIQKLLDKRKDSEVGEKHERAGAVKKREIEMLRHQLELINTKAQDSTVGITSRKTTPRRKRSKHASLR